MLVIVSLRVGRGLQQTRWFGNSNNYSGTSGYELISSHNLYLRLFQDSLEATHISEALTWKRDVGLFSLCDDVRPTWSCGGF